MVKAESPTCIINSTSGLASVCVGESVSKSSNRTAELEACWLDKECALLKGKLRRLM